MSGFANIISLIVGGLVMTSPLVYVILQILTLVYFRERWRWAACVPFIFQIPILLFTVKAYHDQSNLWPVPLIFSSAFAVVILAIEIVIYNLAKKNAAPPKL